MEAEFQTEFLEWDDFLRRFKWRQGEHATFLAPTRGGKTTLALQLADIYRKFILVLATKKKDPQLDRLRKNGYREIESIDQLLWDHPRHLLRPKPRSINDNMRAWVFHDALDTVYRSGHFCVFADELVYLTDSLGLRRHWQTLLREGRTLKITMLSLSQRPAWIPRECYSSATHIFFARTTDKTDLDRVADITGGIDKKVIKHDIQILRPYEWLWINRFEGTAYRIRMPKELAK